MSKAFDLVDHGILFQKLFGSCLVDIVLKQCGFVGINCCLILSLCLMV